MAARSRSSGRAKAGYDIVESTLPALVAVSSGINEPRYPQLKGIMAAKKKEIKVYTAADLGLPADQVGEKGAQRKSLDHWQAAETAGR